MASWLGGMGELWESHPVYLPHPGGTGTGGTAPSAGTFSCPLLPRLEGAGQGGQKQARRQEEKERHPALAGASQSQSSSAPREYGRRNTMLPTWE